MHGGEFIACCKDKIIVSSSSSNADNYKSFGADQEQALEAQALTHDTGLLKCDATTLRGSFYNRMHLPQVRGLVEGQPFNISLFYSHNDLFNNFEKNNII
jgi:hypothetical protein